MTKIKRRTFVGLAAATTTALSMPSIAFGALPRVVVIGGGAGGATAAKYIAKDSKGAIDVTLVEASKRYYTSSAETFAFQTLYGIILQYRHVLIFGRLYLAWQC